MRVGRQSNQMGTRDGTQLRTRLEYVQSNTQGDAGGDGAEKGSANQPGV